MLAFIDGYSWLQLILCFVAILYCLTCSQHVSDSATIPTIPVLLSIVILTSGLFQAPSPGTLSWIPARFDVDLGLLASLRYDVTHSLQCYWHTLWLIFWGELFFASPFGGFILGLTPFTPVVPSWPQICTYLLKLVLCDSLQVQAAISILCTNDIWAVSCHAYSQTDHDESHAYRHSWDWWLLPAVVVYVWHHGGTFGCIDYMASSFDWSNGGGQWLFQQSSVVTHDTHRSWTFSSHGNWSTHLSSNCYNHII